MILIESHDFFYLGFDDQKMFIMMEIVKNFLDVRTSLAILNLLFQSSS